MARTDVAVLLAFLLPAVAPAEEGDARLGASVGIAVASPRPDVPGTGSGAYLDAEYRLTRDGWFTPRLYAGTLLAGTDDEKACGGGACEVSAVIGFAGIKARLRLPMLEVSPFVELGLGASAGRIITRSGVAVDDRLQGVTWQVPVALGVAWGERHRWHVRLVSLGHPEVKQVDVALTLGLEFSPRSAKRLEEAAAAQERLQADQGTAPPEAEVQPPPPEVAAPAVSPDQPGSPAPPTDGEVARRKRGKTYLSAWLGIGGGVINGPPGSGPAGHTEFVPVILFPFPASIGVGFGVPAGRHLLLGGEWDLTLGFNCVATMSEATGACDRGVLLQQLLATATIFPLSRGTPEVAPAGPFVRAGAGGARLDSWAANIAARAPPGSPKPIPWRRLGLGLLAGLGYSLRIGAAITADAGLDFSWQSFGTSGSEPVSSFSSVLHVGATLH